MTASSAVMLTWTWNCWCDDHIATQPHLNRQTLLSMSNVTIGIKWPTSVHIRENTSKV